MPSEPTETTRPSAREPQQPKLGFVGWLRFAWRLLTSMRTAIILLLLLAVAAIPGSLVPQTTSDPNGVIAFRNENPELAEWLDRFGVFSTYSSVWFSAIYILLFVSLIGCVIPRTRHHLQALRAAPPRTPARLSRLDAFTSVEVDAGSDAIVDEAERLLRSRRYRVVRYGASVSAERGYLRETGNLVFHASLIGVLVFVGLGGGLGFVGQRIVPEGQAFANNRSGYDSISVGRFFTDTMLTPFSLKLDSFEVDFEEQGIAGYGMPLDYRANVTITEPGKEPRTDQVKVNAPISIGDTQVYLLGNGYAPVLTIRNPEGTVVFSQPTLYRPMDANLTGLGIVKIPDGLAEQIGIRSLMYPTAAPTDSGAYTSTHPDLLAPLVTMEVYQGDLGLNNGEASSAYVLDTEALTQIAGREADVDTIMLGLGEVADLPNGLGTIELSEIRRYAALEMHSDPVQGWVLLFAVTAMLGLLTSLFVPRRRVWVKAVSATGDAPVTLEVAGLARGEDPRLGEAVDEISTVLVERLSTAPQTPSTKVAP